ncbi:MAG: helix-turn-helix domain-containing protein [Syntrophorhabdaceae bacterium]|nr:helix-turn-helix domain-containing protein [Syntrophorhabdaceae bacterium]
MNEIFFSPAEIAKRFNVKEGTVRRWLYDGTLRGIKLGGLWRIPASALEEFIKTNENIARNPDKIKDPDKH